MQSNGLQTLDYLVFLFYFVVVAGYGYWIYNKKKSELSDSNDFFLAEGSLTWWAIGASLIASNISAEQFIGMSGNGFRLGLAIATYEWMAAAMLLIVAIFFMPIYLKNKIFTMPQFLSQRYSPTVSLIMAVFWLLLYVAVNLTSILYLGALAVTTISGIDFTVCMIGMSVFAVIITLGGMKVIGFTDVIQVFFLILGGLATTYLALQMVSDHFGGEGVMSGLNHLMTKAPEHFHMILTKDNANYPSLPGLTVLIGGMWIINLNYWGCNQYITQRALGADLPTARNGILFAAFLKMLMPIIVVLPGIAAYLLHKDGMFQQEMLKDGVINQDSAYPVLLNLLPAGLKGLSFAALTAAVVASMAGKANSISTIFTLDIYKKYINKDANEKQLVNIGRFAVVAAMVLAIAIAPFMGIDKKGGFEFIQEYTGYVSPGIFALFIMGFFWKRTTSNAALFAMIGGLAFSILTKYIPAWTGVNDCLFYTAFLDGDVYMIPFMDRMGWVFIFCVVSMVIISLADPESKNNPKGLEIDAKMFKLEPSFIAGTVIV
ncbi:MAG: sodium/sugar symporter, partial [Aquirufa sp.]